MQYASVTGADRGWHTVQLAVDIFFRRFFVSKQMKVVMLWVMAGWVFLPILAAAGEKGSPWAGTWQGQIGSAQVQVCVEPDGQDEYYYLRYKRGIRLESLQAKQPKTDTLELVERSGAMRDASVTTGLWTLKLDGQGGLGGIWRDPAKGKQFPIHLSRLAYPLRGSDGRADHNPCPAFHDPITQALKPVVSSAQFKGKPYRLLKTRDAQTFEVPPQVPHAVRINALTRKWLEAQAIHAYECVLGGGGDWQSTLMPIVWTDRYLVLEDLLPEVFCGGAHGDYAISYITWSLQQGRAENTWLWLEGGESALDAGSRRGASVTGNSLKRLLVGQHPRHVQGDECASVLDQMWVAAPYPTQSGLVFPTSFGHAMRACGDDVLLDWKQVAPYLSTSGKKVMNTWGRP